MSEIAAGTGAKPHILVFDSGLGGLTVFRAIRAALPGADYLYLADDARFPYGALEPAALISGVLDVIDAALTDFPADCVVIACNTASTLVLPALRARFSVPIVGTVPAIKPAAAATRSGLISVLATPGTVSRDYTAELIRDFANGVAVTLVARRLWLVSPSVLCAAKLCRMRRLRPKLRPVLWSKTGNAPITLCWPARIIRCFWIVSMRWRPGRWNGSTRSGHRAARVAGAGTRGAGRGTLPSTLQKVIALLHFQR